MPDVKFRIHIDDDEVKALFANWKGQTLRRRVENANLECAAQIKARADRLVHILSGNLKGSLWADFLPNAGSALSGAKVPAAGATAPYAAIEEMRGLSGSWEGADLDEVAKGDHSYLAQAYVDSRDTFAGIFAHWADPATPI